MADEFAEELLEIACAQILGAGGRFSSARASTLSMLASVARVRIERLAEAAARSARHAGRDRVNITDIARVLGEEELLGIGPPISNLGVEDSIQGDLPFARAVRGFPVPSKMKIPPPGAPREPSAPAWCPALPDPHTYLTGRVRVVAEPKSTPDSRAADAHSAGASVLRIHAAEQAAGQAVMDEQDDGMGMPFGFDEDDVPDAEQPLVPSIVGSVSYMRRDQLAELSQRLESGKGKIVGLDDVDMDLATPAPKVGPSKISKKRRKAAKSDAGIGVPLLHWRASAVPALITPLRAVPVYPVAGGASGDIDDDDAVARAVAPRAAADDESDDDDDEHDGDNDNDDDDDDDDRRGAANGAGANARIGGDGSAGADGDGDGGKGTKRRRPSDAGAGDDDADADAADADAGADDARNAAVSTAAVQSFNPPPAAHGPSQPSAPVRTLPLIRPESDATDLATRILNGSEDRELRTKSIANALQARREREEKSEARRGRARGRGSRGGKTGPRHKSRSVGRGKGARR